MHRLRTALLDLAFEEPSIRSIILPMTRHASGWSKLPKGWTQESVEKFWKTLTGEKKHKVTECIERMKDKFDDPGAFCGSLMVQVHGDTSWRSKKASIKWRPYVGGPIRLTPKEFARAGDGWTVVVRPQKDGTRMVAAVNLETGLPFGVKVPFVWNPSDIGEAIREELRMLSKMGYGGNMTDASRFRVASSPVGQSIYLDRDQARGFGVDYLGEGTRLTVAADAVLRSKNPHEGYDKHHLDLLGSLGGRTLSLVGSGYGWFEIRGVR